MNQSSQTIEDPYLTLITSTIELGNDLTSSITYAVTVKNNSDNIATYEGPFFSEDIGYDNPDIEFVVDGINADDTLNPGESTTFNVPLTIGSSLTAGGAPQRYFEGTLKDINVTLYE